MTMPPAFKDLWKKGGRSCGGIAVDSRQVKPGDVFFVLPSQSGRSAFPFIQEALTRGARALVGTREVLEAYDLWAQNPMPVQDKKSLCPVPRVISENPLKDLGECCAFVYAAKPETLVAVTGTNGKSSTVAFLRQFWEAAGFKAFSLGTLGVHGQGGRLLEPLALTSPDALTLHQLLHTLQSTHYTHGALEASSHGLSQYRLQGIPLTAGAFTNLTQDHLDYHGTLESYFHAKRILFTEILPQSQEAVAVLNRDSSFYGALERQCRERGLKILSYGYQGQDFGLKSSVPTVQGVQRLELCFFQKTFSCVFPLVGAFQGLNALCAAALAWATGVSEDLLRQHFPKLQGVPGRLEQVGETPQGAKIFLDYAHSPDALAHVLKALKPYTSGRLKVVFGCGGDRDASKRPLMAQVACAYAHDVIITDDNPRTEDPQSIRQQSLQGCAEALEIPGREEAIVQTLKTLEGGDTLLIAGKGHETGQIIGTQVHDFSDAQVVRDFLKTS